MAPEETTEPSGKHPAVADDRLSALPDGPLHTIMSFLAPWEAVQTCVLSRRWENLWCSMPCLDIDEMVYHCSAMKLDPDSEGADDPYLHAYARGCTRCEDFFNNLLMFHSAPALDRFRIHFGHMHRIDVFRVRGIKRCPAVLEIIFPIIYVLPHLGFSYRLKRLHLRNAILGDNFTRHISSGCPVLEDLELKCCILEDPKITSCTLKNLVVEDCQSCSDINLVLVVTASALTNLQLTIRSKCRCDGVVVNEMPSLIKATLFTQGNLPCQLLCSLINVRDLTLSGPETLMKFHEGSDVFPGFPNLRNLLFHKCDMSDKFQSLPCFMNSAPCLEKLTLEFCKLPGDSRKMITSGQDTPTFQCPNLKRTEIKYKEEDAHKLLVLLLGAWRNLQKTPIVLGIY